MNINMNIKFNVIFLVRNVLRNCLQTVRLIFSLLNMFKCLTWGHYNQFQLRCLTLTFNGLKTYLFLVQQLH
jgi:hypothetical protein